METAKSLKDKGNHYVQERNYVEALKCYSKAIELDSNDPILYSNRSAMYYNLNEYENAIKDADKAISLKSNYPKAYLRKGNALESLLKYDEALNTYNIGLQYDINNAQLLDAYQKLKKKMEQNNTDNLNEYKDIINDNYDKNLVEKYALKKNVKIYLDKQIGENMGFKGIIEDIKDGFIYFKDEYDEFHILNIKNIIDIKIL